MRMEIEVLRIGQRVVRDDRVTTHVALVARSFGAKKIYMNEINPEINDTVSKINKTWGGDFKIEMIDDWKKIIREKKNFFNWVKFFCKRFFFIWNHIFNNNFMFF